MLEWDTTGQHSGDYTVRVKVTLYGFEIFKDTLDFSLLPVGTFTREGTLVAITVQGKPVVGNLLPVFAEFVNTGQIDTRARFNGEVYLDGELIAVLESNELLVPMDDNVILKSYLELDELGEYEVSGYVNYEGKKTEVKTFSFIAITEIVASESHDDRETTAVSEPTGNLWSFIAGGIIGALVLAVIIILTVPWGILQPARKVLLTRWLKLKLACRMLAAH